MFIPFLDSILTELDTRFTPESKERVQGLLLLPKYLDQLNVDDTLISLNMLFLKKCPDMFEQEVRMWKRKWQTVNTDLPQNICHTR